MERAVTAWMKEYRVAKDDMWCQKQPREKKKESSFCGSLRRAEAPRAVSDPFLARGQGSGQQCIQCRAELAIAAQGKGVAV